MDKWDFNNFKEMAVKAANVANLAKVEVSEQYLGDGWVAERVGLGSKFLNSLKRKSVQIGIVAASLAAGILYNADSDKALDNISNNFKDVAGVVSHGVNSFVEPGVSALKGIKTEVKSGLSKAGIIDPVSPINQESRLVSQENYDKYVDIGNIEIPSNVSAKDYGRVLANELFNRDQIGTAFVLAMEGLVLKPSADNIGVTIGAGLNVTMQNKEMMGELAKAISIDKAMEGAYRSIAGVDSVREVSNKIGEYNPTPQQAAQLSEIMMDNVYISAITGQMANRLSARGYMGDATEKAKEMYNSLEDNVKMSIRYMPYNMGGGNFAKYNTLNNLLFEYALNEGGNKRTPEARSKIAKSAKIHYAVKYLDENGKEQRKMVENERVNLAIAAGLEGTEYLKYMVGATRTMPDGFGQFYKSSTGKDLASQSNGFEMPASIDDVLKGMGVNLESVSIDVGESKDVSKEAANNILASINANLKSVTDTPKVEERKERRVERGDAALRQIGIR